MSDLKSIAFIGLGVMGYPMAGHLKKAGFDVCVYNRNAVKAKQWQLEYGGRCADSLEEAVKDCQAVLMCLGRDEDVAAVVLGDKGLLQFLSPRTLLIDHTTTSAVLANTISLAAQKKEVAFIDAPVSGGQVGAQNAKLVIMCGAQADHFESAIPLFSAMAKQWSLMGEVGQGQRCKMANQIAIAGVLQGLSEAIRLAQAAQLDMAELVKVLGGGAAQSWQLDNRAISMAEDRFDFGFAIDWMCKDLDYALMEADKQGLDLTNTQQIRQYYQELTEAGAGRLDTSALIKRIKP